MFSWLWVRNDTRPSLVLLLSCLDGSSSRNWVGEDVRWLVGVVACRSSSSTIGIPKSSSTSPSPSTCSSAGPDAEDISTAAVTADDSFAVGGTAGLEMAVADAAKGDAGAISLTGES
jgi:hypothetical protein